MFNLMGRISGFANLAGLKRRGVRAEKSEDDNDDECPMREPEESDADYAKRCDSYAEDSGDEDMKRKDGESDSDYAKRMDALHDEPDGDEDEDGEEPEGDDNPDKDEDAKKAKKAEARGFKRGYKAAQARGAKILGSKEVTADNIQLAAHLIYNTDLSADAAISTLKTAAIQPANTTARRMASAQIPRIGGGAGSDASGDPVAKSWEQAAAPFMPKKS